MHSKGRAMVELDLNFKKTTKSFYVVGRLDLGYLAEWAYGGTIIHSEGKAMAELHDYQQSMKWNQMNPPLHPHPQYTIDRADKGTVLDNTHEQQKPIMILSLIMCQNGFLLPYQFESKV